MGSMIEKIRSGNTALDTQRRLMNEALARLGNPANRLAMARPPARIIIGLDLTGSREARLPEARVAMASMLDVVRNTGKIMLKLFYYRGTDESCSTRRWYQDIDTLSAVALRLSCESGTTQIGPMLQSILREPEKLSAVVFIGDHCEEDFGTLLGLAADMGRKSVPLFMFHECADHDYRSLDVKPLFKRMAEVSGGIYTEFKPDSHEALKEMLSSIAVLSAGGQIALERLAPPKSLEARQLRGDLRLMLGSGKNSTGRGQ
jgi:hypothetical protein